MFFAALFLHFVVFLLVATWVIFEAPPQRPDAAFQPVKLQPPAPPPTAPPPSGAAAQNALEPDVTVTPPTAPPTLIQTTSAQSFNVAAHVNMPHLPVSLANPKGTGSATGSGASGSGFGDNPFGSNAGNEGLDGNFFDFTRDQSGDPVGPASLGTILQDFIANHWRPEGHTCYKSPNKISTNHLFVPVTPDEVAGAAFQSPESSKAYWLVHYHSVFTSNTMGKFRFVGWGDNVLVVAIDNKVVLDAGDHQSLAEPYSKNVGQMAITGPGKGDPTPEFSGDWFTLDMIDSHTIDIVIGDEGGVTTSGLFIQPEDTTLTFAENGAPKIPLFVIGTLGDGDQAAMSKDLPAVCFNTHLVFTPVADPNNHP
jgi:hypothetical protein